jgi:hypothetical protein
LASPDKGEVRGASPARHGVSDGSANEDDERCTLPRAVEIVVDTALHADLRRVWIKDESEL